MPNRSVQPRQEGGREGGEGLTLRGVGKVDDMRGGAEELTEFVAGAHELGALLGGEGVASGRGRGERDNGMMGHGSGSGERG